LIAVCADIAPCSGTAQSGPFDL